MAGKRCSGRLERTMRNERRDLDAMAAASGATDGAPSRKRRRRQRMLLVAAAAEVGAALIARRAGYGIGMNTRVRCNSGHVFTTIWIPGVSIKALRLGWWRVQWCPVGRHWTLVRPVKDADLSESQLRLAEEHRDVRLP
jgi:hypothetical protein